MIRNIRSKFLPRVPGFQQKIPILASNAKAERGGYISTNFSSFSRWRVGPSHVDIFTSLCGVCSGLLLLAGKLRQRSSKGPSTDLKSASAQWGAYKEP